MKSTGMIRKIDELGRIVIPKEIRNNLNIRENESMEIYIEEDKMILKKFNKLLSLEQRCKELIDVFDKVFNLKIIITDLNKVAVCSKPLNEEFNNKEITKELFDLINDRKVIISKEIKNLNWFKNAELKSCSILFPIIDNTELLGGIIMISEKKITDYEIAIIKLFSLLIKKI